MFWAHLGGQLQRQLGKPTSDSSKGRCRGDSTQGSPCESHIKKYLSLLMPRKPTPFVKFTIPHFLVYCYKLRYQMHSQSCMLLVRHTSAQTSAICPQQPVIKYPPSTLRGPQPSPCFTVLHCTCSPFNILCASPAHFCFTFFPTR